jgi:subtilisin family serine protease
VSRRLIKIVVTLTLAAFPVIAVAQEPDPERDILVTFENAGARTTTTSAPYRNRKRYAITPEAKRQAAAVAEEYRLQQIDHWPIRALSVYCFVYRVANGEDRAVIIDHLRADVRVESVQPLNAFETGARSTSNYDDTYVDLQHGLDTLDLTGAHRHTRGKGVRIAVIDSNADTHHEDLKGRVRELEDFADDGANPDRYHGTAVTSVIGANANNAKGIVGIAPEANVELYVACWSDAASNSAVCDSFTLAKAIDTLLERPPDILNLSLNGPTDPLVQRLLLQAHERGVIMIAAHSSDHGGQENFPASMSEVIDVGSSKHSLDRKSLDNGTLAPIFAPGEQILVAIPDDAYDFRSGNSLAAAHVSGVVALLLAITPDAPVSKIQSLLQQSQLHDENGQVSVNACKALQLADQSLNCES